MPGFLQIGDVFVRQMQDTMVALEALTEFSSRDTNRGLYTMLVNVLSTSTNGWQEKVLLSKGNFTSYTTMSVREIVTCNIIYIYIYIYIHFQRYRLGDILHCLSHDSISKFSFFTFFFPMQSWIHKLVGEDDDELFDGWFQIPDVWGSVRATVEGTGYALMQLTTKINVEHDYQLRQPVQQAFDLEVDALRWSGRNASRMEMVICAK